MVRSSSSTGIGVAPDPTEAARIATQVRSALMSAGMDSARASKYAQFCQDLINFIQNNPQLQEGLQEWRTGKKVKNVWEVYEGSRKAATATKYLNSAKVMTLVSAGPGLRDYRAGGAASALSGFVDLFEGYAKANGIELNECSLAISKLSLDFAGVAVGGATAMTGWGLVLAGLSVLATFKDSYGLGGACLPSR